MAQFRLVSVVMLHFSFWHMYESIYLIKNNCSECDISNSNVYKLESEMKIKINELNINKVLFVTMFILFILSVLSIYPTIRQAEAIKYQYNLLK